ncbi:hypothetical protein D3C81_500230 [compost metagenome]
MSCLEQGHAVTDVGTRRDANTAHLGSQGVGDVVTVQVHTGDDVILGRTQQYLLQEGIGDDVLDDDGLAGLRVLEGTPGAAVDELGIVLFLGQGIAPILEGTFGELHDVALVHQGHGVAIVVDGVLDGGTDQTLGTGLGHGLDADAAGLGEADLLHAHLVLQEGDHLLGFIAVRLPLDAGVDVFGVLAEDHHVGQLGVLDRARGPFVVTNRAQADVEIQLLTQGHVEGANTATDRGGQRALDGHAVFTNEIQGFGRQPGTFAIDMSRFLAGINLHPGDLALALVGFLDRSVHHVQHGRGHVHTDTIPFDKRNDGIVGNLQLAAGIDGDFLTLGRDNYFAFHRHLLTSVCYQSDR